MGRRGVVTVLTLTLLLAGSVAEPASARRSRPDLKVLSMLFQADTFAGGHMGPINVNVKNKGTKKSPPWAWGTYLSSDAILDNLDIAMDGEGSVLGELKPGKTSEHYVLPRVPESTPPGPYYVIVCADDPNVIKELKETNNCLTSAAPVTIYTEAAVEINEVAPSIAGGLDLVEVEVVTGGRLRTQLRYQPASGQLLLAEGGPTDVASGDLIVYHLKNDVDPPVGTTETSLKTECVLASCYAGAWDVFAGSGTTGLPASNQVVYLVNGFPLGGEDGDIQMQDAVALTNNAASSSQFRDDVSTTQSLGEWLPADCGGVACGDATTPTIQGISVDMTGVGTTPTGNSIQRQNSDTGLRGDWAVEGQTFGAANVP